MQAETTHNLLKPKLQVSNSQKRFASEISYRVLKSQLLDMGNSPISSIKLAGFNSRS
jgi:hypothetical protein